MDRYSELEHKWDGTHITVPDFHRWALAQGPYQYKRIDAIDTYYIQGDNVVRHRRDGDAGILTVKCRKSSKSITDRVEVDLLFAPSISEADVATFLVASGWKRHLSIWKDAHIYWLKHGKNAVSTFALYDAMKLSSKQEGRPLEIDSPRRFLEAEIEKHSIASDQMGLELLKDWREKLTKEFKLGAPLNDSLYEIFSGGKYKIARK